MDLKIKDVAELLNVSETTIRRWLVDRKIPAYRINGQYRFSRIEIEDWVMAQKLDQHTKILTHSRKLSPSEGSTVEDSHSSVGSHQFRLFRALHKGGVYHNVPGDTKEEVIKNSVKDIADSLDLDGNVLTELLLDRERLMPTALNNGVGVPHTRDFLLDTQFDVVTIVFPEKLIDYGALDHKPVHSLFFLLSSKDKNHLHLLAKIAHLCSIEENIEFLKQRPEKKELMDHVKNWEIQIQATLVS
jgi:nitrogen PTS system EIIA component